MSREVVITRGTAAGPWWREVTPDGWRALRAAGIGWLFEVYDVFLLSLTIPAFLHDFGISKAEAGLIGTSAAVSQIVGGIVGGWLADRIGRVRTLTLAIAAYAVFTGLTVFAPSIGMVAATRVLAGLGMGAQWTSGAALVAETWPARHRGKGGALMQAGLPLGSLLAVAVSYAVTAANGTLLDGGWRWLYGVGALPLLFALYVWRRTPESPKWLAGRSDEEPRGTVRGLFTSGNVAPLLLAFGFVFFVQYIYWAVFTFAPTFLEQVKGATEVGGLGFVLAQQIGSLAGFVLFALVVDRWGRKPTYICYLVLGGIALALFVTLSGTAALYAVSFLTGLGVTGLFAGLGPWAAEMMFRSPSRGLAMGVIYNGGRVGGALAPYVVGSLATSPSGFQVGMGTAVVAFVCALVIMLASKETKGRELAP